MILLISPADRMCRKEHWQWSWGSRETALGGPPGILPLDLGSSRRRTVYSNTFRLFFLSVNY